MSLIEAPDALIGSSRPSASGWLAVTTSMTPGRTVAGVLRNPALSASALDDGDELHADVATSSI